MIVGTAGHIDHGKTALVRALTGIDTDRLKEERERGISIELGFAYVPVEGMATPGADAILGFVDVPGHERFVHTMAAGANGIDFALLVVAADDGVMPQTREHLAILRLLGVARGAVAITKVDRVDAERVNEFGSQLDALLADTPFADAPRFMCAALQPDDPGTAALRACLHAAARADADHATDDAHRRFFRMPIDRAFSLPGHGTVVAGPLLSGETEVDATVRLMPAGEPVRVRSIHAQNRPVSRAAAGTRCALNLAGIDAAAVHRGEWLADPRALVPTRRIDVRLSLLEGVTRLRDWTPLHVHWGASHRLGHAVMLEAANDARGALVQLVFDRDVCAACGDRFIVRDAGASATVGGGVVLDPEAPQRRRRSPARIDWLKALEAFIDDGDIGALLQQADAGIPVARLERLYQRPIDALVLPAGIVRIATRDGAHVLAERRIADIGERVHAGLADWHARHPEEPGIETSRLHRNGFQRLPAALFDSLLARLREVGAITRNGPWWALPGHAQALTEKDRALLQTLLPRLLQGGFDPPWVRDLAGDTRVPEAQVRGVLRRAAARGELYQVVPDLFYHPQRIAELADHIAELAQAGVGVEAAAFRDRIGLGRKRSIQLLEFFDRVGYTRRVGDAHRPRDDLGWSVRTATPSNPGKACASGHAAGLQTQ